MTQIMIWKSIMRSIGANRSVIKAEALLHGPDAVKRALDRAEELERQGDLNGALQWRRRGIALKEYFELDEKERKRKEAIKPAQIRLYAAFTGLSVNECVEISNGLWLDHTFAHVMAPFILAFSPAEDGKPHPGPWKSASGGIAVDVYAQATLEEGVNIGAFDRLNSIWFLATLVRLKISDAIRVPFISDTSFSEVADGAEPVFWPVELNEASKVLPFHTAVDPMADVLWVSRHIEKGAALMTDEGFSLAIQSNDRAYHAESLGTAMVLFWSSVEALFRPGGRDITKTLSIMVATYLSDNARVRDRTYQEIKALYKVRGDMIHAARMPDRISVERTAKIARQALIRSIEEGQLPEGQRLLTAWSNRKAY
ncbi:hypothetical protein U5903_16990 [Cereibacter johrii]|uniref:hypothetical protein n=1 Tax=Cereibacter johrii TaxID=445629 RepID=UPI002B25F302|nr:hypothetical protein [Cereibacter johrii]MEA5162477.1 hypothetical protein [Cereibacter johrii]